MTRGNRPMRVANEFNQIVQKMRKELGQTSAEITRSIALNMKRVK